MSKKFLSALLLLIISIFSVSAFEKPLVKNIRAVYTGSGKVEVSWIVPEDSRPPVSNIFIYRTLKPVSKYSQLEKETPVQVLSSDASSYTDSITDFNEYFYTVIAMSSSRTSFTIIPSQNTTVKGVRIDIPVQKPAKDVSRLKGEKIYEEGTMRETPLPFLDIIENQNSRRRQMNLQASTAAKNLGCTNKLKETNAFLKPYIFEEDLISPESGDDVFLFEILKDYFIQHKYQESQIEFQRLAGTNISEDVYMRTVFYLGESYYFQGNYEKAVKNFLKTSEKFPVVSKKWIDSSLDMLELPDYQ